MELACFKSYIKTLSGSAACKLEFQHNGRERLKINLKIIEKTYFKVQTDDKKMSLLLPQQCWTSACFRLVDNKTP